MIKPDVIKRGDTPGGDETRWQPDVIKRGDTPGVKTVFAVWVL